MAEKTEKSKKIEDPKPIDLKEQMKEDFETLLQEREQWQKQLDLSRMNVDRLNGVIAYLRSKLN